MSTIIVLLVLTGMGYVVYHQYAEQTRKYLKRKQRKEKWKN